MAWQSALESSNGLSIRSTESGPMQGMHSRPIILHIGEFLYLTVFKSI
ncbi:predicted protein [Botrytis cinerea T4]|uniref:Uncharacterized protein n=1 Tax=Botryotinia fuckeliana (strain T4) TaxID=999810 RepID=G2YAY2_BOTF4|nr:predicted protein [Botrytis cinerea T4]